MGIAATAAGKVRGYFARPETPTAAQLGNAVLPAAHTATAPLVGAPPVHGADLPRADASVWAPRLSRSFRAGPSHAMPPGVPTVVGDGGPNVAPHMRPGPVDARDVWGGTAGHSGPTQEALRPAAEVNVQTPMASQVVNAEPLLDRPRAGSTGADPAREAKRPFAGFFRAFDQWAVYGPSSVAKLPLVVQAGLPISQDAPVGDAIPAPGGSGDTRMAGIGIQPNSFRLMPVPWDQLLVNTGGPAAGAGDPGAAAVAGRRARGWRAS